MARDPALRPYRIAVIVAFLTLTVLFCALLIRSIAYDLYGRQLPRALQRAGPQACVDDLQRQFRRLQAHLGSTPETPGGVREFQNWALRWEEQMAQVNARCHLDDPGEDPVSLELAAAYGALDELRRHAARCSDEGTEGARTAKESLDRAQKLIRGR